MSTDIVSTGLVAGTWNVDAAHSEVAFTVRHLMSKVRGTFGAFSGTIVTQGEDPTASTVEVSIEADSISTNNEQRDGHLRSNDFFSTSEVPAITFVSTGISGDEDGYVITGDLTIKGVTRSVDLAAEFFGVAVDAYGLTRLGAEASTTIVRKDFGVDFNVPLDGGKFLIGDKVEIHLTIEAVKA
jgi:polyisoprenoid-binding protein YceI